MRNAYGTKPSGEVQPLQWAILRYVQATPENRCTMSLISKHLGLTHAPVGRAIQTLAKRHFIVQVTHPKDARSKLVRLTEAGIGMLERDPILKLAERFDVLTPGDLQRFKQSIYTIAHRFD